MSESKKPKLDAEDEKIKKEKDETLEHAEALYRHVKNKANALYDDSIHSVHDAQEHLKQQRDNLAQHVREKPLTSLLIAGGIGFIISAILRK